LGPKQRGSFPIDIMELLNFLYFLATNILVKGKIWHWNCGVLDYFYVRNSDMKV